MTCDTALERLLEAEPTELMGRGDSELAAHLRGCDRCSAVAAELLEAQDQLAGALDDVAPRVSVDEALATVRARTRRDRPGRWRPAWRWAAPVAAAAAVTAIFMLSQPDARRMPGEPMEGSAPKIEPLVEMPTARNVMVFETKDRSTKVIWFY